MPETSVPIKWRKQGERYMLKGSACECGSVFYPERTFCSCGRKTIEKCFSGDGEIISFTEIHAAPAGFEFLVPYTVALIKLKEGPVMPAHIAEGKADIGKKVRPVFRKIREDGNSGIIIYGIKFVVV